MLFKTGKNQQGYFQPSQRVDTATASQPDSGMKQWDLPEAQYHKACLHEMHCDVLQPLIEQKGISSVQRV